MKRRIWKQVVRIALFMSGIMLLGAGGRKEPFLKHDTGPFLATKAATKSAATKSITTKSTTAAKSTKAIAALTAFDLDKYLKPYWKDDIMYNESLAFVPDDKGNAEAPLLYKPSGKITVSSSGLNHVYKEGTDWVYKDGKIKLTKNSSIPTITKSTLYPVMKLQGSTFPRKGGGNVILMEGSYFHEHQAAVTYEHKDKWKGPIPQYAGNLLPKTIQKLKNKEPLRILFYGDSITTGALSSAYMKVAPFAPTWYDMLKLKLTKVYSSEITSINTAVGGMVSSWGVENAQTRAADQHPDLAVIAFGMNDGSHGVTAADLISNLVKIMDTILKKNKNCEFILVLPMIPSSEAMFGDVPILNLQFTYPEAVKKLEKTGVAVADITAVNKEIFKKKRFVDMTGNNINHPNDFTARLYAQVLCSLTIKE